jgi:hypothetical protein
MIPALAPTLFMPTVSSGGLDSATTAWISAVGTNGGTVSGPQQTLINNLIVGLKADGIWALLDRLWIYAGENEPSALTDMVARSLSTKQGTPPFVAFRGYNAQIAGDGIATGFNPSTAGGNYTQNSAHHSFWDITTAVHTQRILSNATAGTDFSHMFNWYTDGNFYNRICSAVGAGFAVADSRGFFLGNRSASGATQSYLNGASVGSDTQVSSALINSTYVVFNDPFTGADATLHQIAMVSFGGSLNSTQVGNFYTRLRTYGTAVGVP